MGTRDYKIFTQGNYYHIYNRGNGKNNIFLDAQDYKVFLYRLRENLFPQSEPATKNTAFSPRYTRKSLPPNAFTLVCYCLMPNHFHFLIRQDGLVKISKLVQKLCTGYAFYFKQRYELAGHLFQGAFNAINVDNDSYLMWLSAYIHQNPLVAGLVNNLEDYQYSSYLDYIGKRNGSLCNKEIILSNFKSLDDYKKFVLDSGQLIKQRKEIQSLLLD